jgi:hypothetical protein
VATASGVMGFDFGVKYNPRLYLAGVGGKAKSKTRVLARLLRKTLA